MFKSGDSPGEHELQLVIHSPTGKRSEGPKKMMTFTGEPTGGGNVRIHLGIVVIANGLYLVDVRLDGKVVTTMPLLITLKREEPAKEEAATSPNGKARGKAKPAKKK
jgi:hypothetical protein